MDEAHIWVVALVNNNKMMEVTMTEVEVADHDVEEDMDLEAYYSEDLYNADDNNIEPVIGLGGSLPMQSC